MQRYILSIIFAFLGFVNPSLRGGVCQGGHLPYTDGHRYFRVGEND